VESNDIHELVVAGNPMSLVTPTLPRKHAEIGAVGQVRTNPRLFFFEIRPRQSPGHDGQPGKEEL